MIEGRHHLLLLHKQMHYKNSNAESQLACVHLQSQIMCEVDVFLREILIDYSTMLSQASTQGCSQLKHQKIEGEQLHGERCFNGSTILHPRCEASCRGTESTIVASPMLGESCIVLENTSTCSLAAKFLQCLSLTVCEFSEEQIL